MTLELPRAAAHRRLGEIDAVRLQAFSHLRGDGLAIPLGQLRLGIEGIHMAHAAVHEQVDYRLGSRPSHVAAWAPADSSDWLRAGKRAPSRQTLARLREAAHVCF